VPASGGATVARRPSVDHPVTSWLTLCREAAGDIHHLLAELPTRAERSRVVGDGMGGDQTVAIDLAAENAVVRRLEALHASGLDFVLISEELGERRFGDEPELYVVVDPIDGSVNAKCCIPFFSLSVAVATGPCMADVVFGYVHDFGSGEEWTAEAGQPPRLDGLPLETEGPREEIELLSLEGTTATMVAEFAGRLSSLAPRLRIMGSLALSLCHLAAGRVDAVVSLKPVRSIDIAAAQLLLRQRGFVIDLPESRPFEEAPVALDARSRVVAARTPELAGRLAAALER
jgi:myo-inositol-1(or 4)-monophosphatase